MTRKLTALFLALSCLRAFALGPEQDKEFVDKYKAAYEAGDKATLESMLYTRDALPVALTFYKTMQADGAGKAKIAKIELVDLTAEDVKQASETQTGPGGVKAKFSLTPVKKLRITLASKDSAGSSNNTMSMFVAESEGKYVIPVPAPAK